MSTTNNVANNYGQTLALIRGPSPRALAGVGTGAGTEVDCRSALLTAVAELTPALRPVRTLLDACRDDPARFQEEVLGRRLWAKQALDDVHVLGPGLSREEHEIRSSQHLNNLKITHKTVELSHAQKALPQTESGVPRERKTVPWTDVFRRKVAVSPPRNKGRPPGPDRGLAP